MRPLINAVLAASLVLAPTVSVAAGSSAPPPVAPQARASADLQNPNQIDDNWLLYGGGLILLLILLFVLLDGDDEDAPVSP